MASQKIIFLGAKAIAYDCLQYLMSQCHHLDIEVTGYATNDQRSAEQNKDIHQLASHYRIPCIKHLDDIPPCDIIYSVQYHEILKEEHIQRAGHIAVNLHMAPLPEYRGCNQFSLAILDDKTEFGVTIHRMDSRIDHGEILFEHRFPIPENCWVNELYEITYRHALDLFKNTLKSLVEKDYTLTPQSELISQRGTALHFRKEINHLKYIDLNWDANKIHKHIRACSMPGFEPPYTIVDSQKIYFCKEWVKG